jgi:hypothetical protein
VIVRLLRGVPRLETAIVVAAVALLAGLGALQQRQQTPAPPFSYSSYGFDAGGLRAFYDMLAREGVSVERFEQPLGLLDPALDTLVYVEPSPDDPRAAQPTAADVAALEAWVRGGGRLLYVGHDDAAAARGVLGLPTTVAPAAARATPTVAPELAAVGVARVDASGTLRWNVAKRRARDRHVLAGDARGAIVVAYPLGAGRVVAVVDEDLFTNAAIATGNRARLAYALAVPRRTGGTVAFDEAVHGHLVVARWWEIVPRPFALALAIAVATLLVAIAGAAIRLGPPVVPPPRDDRSSAEFIDAFASLCERGGTAPQTLRDALRSTTRAACRALGLPDDTSLETLAARLERDAAAASFVELIALARRPALDDASFVRGVALAQQLRKDFIAHGRPRL